MLMNILKEKMNMGLQVLYKKNYYHRWQYQNTIDEDVENTKIEFWWITIWQSNKWKYLLNIYIN